MNFSFHRQLGTKYRQADEHYSVTVKVSCTNKIMHLFTKIPTVPKENIVNIFKLKRLLDKFTYFSASSATDFDKDCDD